MKASKKSLYIYDIVAKRFAPKCEDSDMIYLTEEEFFFNFRSSMEILDFSRADLRMMLISLGYGSVAIADVLYWIAFDTNAGEFDPARADARRKKQVIKDLFTCYDTKSDDSDRGYFSYLSIEELANMNYSHFFLDNKEILAQVLEQYGFESKVEEGVRYWKLYKLFNPSSKNYKTKEPI